MSGKDVIERSFSRCARHYDRYSGVQDKTAGMLIEQLEGREYGSILDIGCGTGNYTALLRERFPESRITAIDVSSEMLEVARGKLGAAVNFVAGDGETIRAEKAFDLITSNACFQWFENLERAMANCGVSLRENGRLLFSAFGPGTYGELAELLGEISSSNFANGKKISEAMVREFENVTARERVFTEEYATLMELLNTIKYTGTRGRGIGGRGIGRQKLAQMETDYLQRFGGIVATYQVFFCYGEKRGQ